ncbi:MAG: hypothetical protein EBR86_07150 [Planctomycetia bacterium]|nr:hypothetical protein [Planctomycetia bacterium]
MNTSGTTPGPFAYVTGTSPTTSIVSTATGAAGQNTLPAGTWTIITCAPARIAGTVSLVRSPTLATTYDPGNGAGSGSSPYSTSPNGTPTVAGWFTQPWSFPYIGDAANSGTGLVTSGSVASMSIEYFKTFGVNGNANANILGYGNYQATFQYTIDGVTGNQVGAMIPYASTVLPKDLIWNTTSGTWNTSATNWTTSGGGSYAFAAGDSVTFSGTGGGTVTLSGSLAPSAVTVSATAGTYTLQSSSGNQITGTTGLTKSGAGTLTLAGPNAYSGTTNLQAGTIRAGSDGAFGSGTLDLDGGTLASDGAGARSFSNPVAIGGNVTFGDGTGTGAVTLAGAVDLGGATRSLTTVADTTVSGTISNGGLTKLGAGTLTRHAHAHRRQHLHRRHHRRRRHAAIDGRRRDRRQLDRHRGQRGDARRVGGDGGMASGQRSDAHRRGERRRAGHRRRRVGGQSGQCRWRGHAQCHRRLHPPG